VSVQAPLPEHDEELQPTKPDPVAGVPVRMTVVPPEKFAVQVAPQSIPEGELVTVPVPVPAGVMVRAY
jgi:hypothetical protein